MKTKLSTAEEQLHERKKNLSNEEKKPSNDNAFKAQKNNVDQLKQETAALHNLWRNCTSTHPTGLGQSTNLNLARR